MDMINLPFNKLIGLTYSDKPEYIFMLENKSDYHNHIATVHASALFALAEASSGRFLFEEIAELDDIIPVVGKVEIKYIKPALGEIYSTASFQGVTRADIINGLKESDKFKLAVGVSLFNKQHELLVVAEFGWAILKKKP